MNCKKTSKAGPIYLPKFEIERLAAMASQSGVQGLICFGFRRTPILAVTLEQIRHLRATRLSYKLYPTDGHPLIKLLGGAKA